MIADTPADRIETIADTARLPAHRRGGVLVIGNFDGVHLGHRRVMDIARKRAAGNPAGVAVMSFEPHPRELFRPDDPPFRLTSAAARGRLLAGAGADVHVIRRFDRSFAQLSPDAFVADIVAADLAPSHVVVGADFRFGRGRAGTAEDLVRLGERLGFAVTLVEEACDEEGAGYGSSRIREFIAAGHLRAAAAALGHDWEIEGTVIRGDRRGRQLGFPTANVGLGSYLRPAFGVYAVRCAVVAPQAEPPRWRDGVANVGIRPMWRTGEPMVEAHLFDFDADLYGKTLRIALVDLLRPEARFAGVEALVAQMHRDCAAARAALAGAG